MIYITGDIHGMQKELRKVICADFVMPNDKIIITGDYGVGFFRGDDGSFTEEEFYDRVEKEFKGLLLFCDGNHENFDKLNHYPEGIWDGGKVHFIRSNIIHLERGEMYEIEGKTVFVFGGGYSYDRSRRVKGVSYWEEEMPSQKEYDIALKNLQKVNYRVDYVITHSAPYKTVEYMTRCDGAAKGNMLEEQELTGFLEHVMSSVAYQKWYFGHFHVDKELWHNQMCLLNDVREAESGKVIFRRNTRDF